MKLIRCYVENFGKLHEFEHQFTDGLNIINEQNGFGKTTFATFIKSMFYGLDAGTNVKTENSERKRYMPWQGGIYGGNLEFETGNKKYRIERFFGKKQSEDTFKLYDLSTNLESKDFTENIGEEIFKVNKNGYERSTYIPQGKIKIDMEDSLSAKLGNVLESENDINTSEEALNRLSETKKIYQKDRGKGGLIDDKKDKLNYLKRKLENNTFDIQTLEAKTNKLNEINNEIKEQEIIRNKNQKLLSEIIEQDRKIAKLETYKAISDKCIQAQEKLKELDEFFKEDSSNKLKNITEKNIDDTIRNYYNLLEIDKELQIKMKEKEEARKQIKKNKKTYIGLLILGLILLVSGIVLSNKIQYIVGTVGIILGIFSILFGIIVLCKGKNNKLQSINKKMQEIEADKEEAEKQINTILQEFDLKDDDKIMALTNLKAEYNSYNDLLNLKKKEYTVILKQFETSKQEKEKYEAENNIKEIKDTKNFTGLSENELKNKINEINNKLDSLIDAKNQLKNQIEILENQIDENEFLETDIENLKLEIEEITNKYQVLKKTEEFLKTAKESFSSSYLQKMVDEFNKYLKLIDNKDLNTDIDIKLDVKVEANGSKKEIKYFSSGYKDLIYICMRFSLVKALFEDEYPFIILDDPFVNLDKEKTTKALEVINEFAKQYQIIYLVCNSSRI